MKQDIYDDYKDYTADGIVVLAYGVLALVYGITAYALLYLFFNEDLAIRSTYFVLSGYALFCVCAASYRLSSSAAYSYAVRQGIILLWMSCGAAIAIWAFLHALEYSFHTMALPVQLGMMSGLAVTALTILADWEAKLYPQIRSWYVSLFAGMGFLGTCIVAVIDKSLGLLPQWYIVFWGLFLVFVGKRQSIYKVMNYFWGFWFVSAVGWHIIVKGENLVYATMYIPIGVLVLLFCNFFPRESIRFQAIWSALKRVAIWLLLALVGVLLAQMMSDNSIALVTRSLRGLAMIGFAMLLVVWRKSSRS